MKKMNKKGFTLIEMLVVIAIIAILVAIIIPTVSNATTKAKEATDVANIRSLVAQYQIATMGTDAEKTAALKALTDFKTDGSAKFPDKYTAPSGTPLTVKYVTTTLTDGNAQTNKKGDTYTWTLGDLVTESTTTPTT